MARNLYKQKLLKSHRDLEGDSCLAIYPMWTHIGASPDGTVCCACCSKGVVEVKYPYCHRNESVYDSATTDKNFCLNKCLDDTDTDRLDHAHSYYYQVQTQIIVCDVEYCDFVLCTFPVNIKPEIFCERIQAYQDFWTQCLTKSTDFFNICMLPEFLGRWYTRPFASSSSVSEISTLPDPSSEKNNRVKTTA